MVVVNYWATGLFLLKKLSEVGLSRGPEVVEVGVGGVGAAVWSALLGTEWEEGGSGAELVEE